MPGAGPLRYCPWRTEKTQALKASENPFDLAHLAGLRAWKSRGSEARKLDYLKEMLGLLEERGWPHADKAQLLVFMEGVIHLTEDASSREEGIQLGRTEGIQLGEIRGRTETARNLLRMGLDVTHIAEATGLPLEEVQALKENGRALTV